MKTYNDGLNCDHECPHFLNNGAGNAECVKLKVHLEYYDGYLSACCMTDPDDIELKIMQQEYKEGK